MKFIQYLFKDKVIQYLIVYNLNGTPVGTYYTISLDFPMSKVGSNANDTSVNILNEISRIHNENYEPKLPSRYGISIVNMTRIN